MYTLFFTRSHLHLNPDMRRGIILSFPFPRSRTSLDLCLVELRIPAELLEHRGGAFHLVREVRNNLTESLYCAINASSAQHITDTEQIDR